MKWNRLDLRKKDLSPRVGQLVAIRMTPKNDRNAFYGTERYEIGRFELENKKLWWRRSTGTDDPSRLKQYYNIWWCPVAEFDGL